jgi:hypothetical protein
MTTFLICGVAIVALRHAVVASARIKGIWSGRTYNEFDAYDKELINKNTYRRQR